MVPRSPRCGLTLHLYAGDGNVCWDGSSSRAGWRFVHDEECTGLSLVEDVISQSGPSFMQEATIYNIKRFLGWGERDRRLCAASGENSRCGTNYCSAKLLYARRKAQRQFDFGSAKHRYGAPMVGVRKGLCELPPQGEWVRVLPMCQAPDRCALASITALFLRRAT
jgi:hypothetical protein